MRQERRNVWPQGITHISFVSDMVSWHMGHSNCISNILPTGGPIIATGVFFLRGVVRNDMMNFVRTMSAITPYILSLFHTCFTTEVFSNSPLQRPKHCDPPKNIERFSRFESAWIGDSEDKRLGIFGKHGMSKCLCEEFDALNTIN